MNIQKPAPRKIGYFIEVEDRLQTTLIFGPKEITDAFISVVPGIKFKVKVFRVPGHPEMASLECSDQYARKILAQYLLDNGWSLEDSNLSAKFHYFRERWFKNLNPVQL